MNVEALTSFFMWCSILGTGLYFFWVLCVVLMPEFIYGVQTRWFPISRETYNIVMYSFLGVFKIVLILFAIIPYVSLLIMG